MLLNQEMGCGSVFLFFAFEAGVRDLLLHTPASPTPQFTLVLFFWLCWRNGLRGYAVNSSLKISLQKPQVLSFPSPFYGTVLRFYWHTSESDKSQQKSRSLWEKRDRQHLQQHSHANKMYMEAHSEAFSSLFQSSTKWKINHLQLLVTGSSLCLRFVRLCGHLHRSVVPGYKCINKWLNTDD